MYQRLSKSAARSPLNRKNVSHAVGAATANGRFTRSQAPAVVQREHDRAVGPAFPQPLRDERHREQGGIELGGGAEPESDAGAAIPPRGRRRAGRPSRAPRRRGPSSPCRRRAGWARGRSRGREIRSRRRASRRSRPRSRVSSRRVDPEERARSRRRRSTTRARITYIVRTGYSSQLRPSTGSQASRNGQPRASELLGVEQRHDVGVAEPAVLTEVAPLAGGARGLRRGAERHRADHAREDHAEAGRLRAAWLIAPHRSRPTARR